MTTTINLTQGEVDHMGPETRTALRAAWSAGNDAGRGETVEDYTQDTIDEDAGVNDLAGALDGELVLRSEADDQIAVYQVGEVTRSLRGQLVGVGDAHVLWLVVLGYVACQEDAVAVAEAIPVRRCSRDR